MQALLFNRIDSLGRVHPEWASYDLITHTLAALHLVIENDRLTGGHTQTQIIDELSALVSLEGPEDSPEIHRELAAAVVGVLLNSRDRQARYRGEYLRYDAEAGTVSHPPLSFRLVETVGRDDDVEPTLRATPEAINIFQNLIAFDPSDRAAAERYRSERMLERKDYDEVLHSVSRRETSVHGLQKEFDALLRRMERRVRDVDYAVDVAPKLDEAAALIREQVDAEQRFADTVAEHMHLHAPDHARLQRITDHLRELIHALTRLLRTTSLAVRTFEEQQDRQLFTYRRITINPTSDLLGPLMHATPGQLEQLLRQRLAVFLSPAPRRVLNLQTVLEKTAPAERTPSTGSGVDPFALGEVRAGHDDLDPEVLAAVTDILASVTEPTFLSQLLATLHERADLQRLTPRQRLRLPWTLAVVVTSSYFATDMPEAGADPEPFDRARFALAHPGRTFQHDSVGGDDLLVLSRSAPAYLTPPSEET
ncbi:hypothetical protein ABZT47_28645 [Sphaerisporangium sp. NPDC005289]|uniref:hypothetical protein n=1 Tax=Sphaerisporangium sp. NPDC005289 TaxID=3155247 RepID=UPI0033BA755D